jgi:hypothetical protein
MTKDFQTFIALWYSLRAEEVFWRSNRVLEIDFQADVTLTMVLTEKKEG